MDAGFDLNPALRMMLMGIAVALGPLFWLWLRQRQKTPGERLRALALLTLFLTFDLVLFGAFTRLTDSGLGCPDWPGCYGHASPVGAHAAITEAQAALPSGPVTHGKAWVEMLHRYMATGVGVLIVTLTLASWLERRNSRANPHAPGLPSPWWATLTLLVVCLQGAFGALTVTMKLFPAIVTLHLLGALLLLALLAAQVTRYGAGPAAAPLRTPVPARVYAAWWGVSLLLVLQIALGGWVSTNYAVLACQDFPSCQGSWWPSMDFSQGFTLWRELGMTGTGATATPVSFAALTAIHYSHRLMAVLVLLALAGMAWALHRQGLARQGRLLGALTGLQLLTGLSNVVLGWPMLAALAHTGGAAALLVVLVWSLMASRAQPTPSPAAVRSGQTTGLTA